MPKNTTTEYGVVSSLHNVVAPAGISARAGYVLYMLLLVMLYAAAQHIYISRKMGKPNFEKRQKSFIIVPFLF